MKHAQFRKTMETFCQLPQDAPIPPELLAQARTLSASRRKRLSFPQFLCRQIQFIGLKVWAAQLLCLGLLWLGLSTFLGQSFYQRPQWAIQLLLCLSVVVAMAAPPFLYRSVRYGMQEVEAAARFSSLSLLLARMLILAIGDLALFSGLLFFAVARSPLPLTTALLSLGLPFLIFSGGALFLLSHCSAKVFFAGSTALGAALLVGILNLGRFLPSLLAPEQWPVHLAVLALLLIFSAQQLRRLFFHSPYPSSQVLSYQV